MFGGLSTGRRKDLGIKSDKMWWQGRKTISSPELTASLYRLVLGTRRRWLWRHDIWLALTRWCQPYIIFTPNLFVPSDRVSINGWVMGKLTRLVWPYKGKCFLKRNSVQKVFPAVKPVALQWIRLGTLSFNSLSSARIWSLVIKRFPTHCFSFIYMPLQD